MVGVETNARHPAAQQSRQVSLTAIVVAEFHFRPLYEDSFLVLGQRWPLAIGFVLVSLEVGFPRSLVGLANRIGNQPVVIPRRRNVTDPQKKIGEKSE
jgi:hypothetical protein